MNFVLPLGRLSYATGTSGKPLQLTAALGRPVLFWLLDSLQIESNEDVLWVAVSAKDEAAYQIYDTISAEYRELKTSHRLKLIPLHFKTRGVIETLYVILQYMSHVDLQKRTLCFNCDMIFESSVTFVSRSLETQSVGCFLAPTSELVTDGVEPLTSECNWCHCALVNNAECSASLSDVRDSKGKRFVKCAIADVKSDNRLDTVLAGAYAFGSAHLLSMLVSEVLQTSSSKLGFPELIRVSMHRLRQECYGILMPGDVFTPLKCGRHVQSFIHSTARMLTHSQVKAQSSTRYVFQMYGAILTDRLEPRRHVLDAIRQLRELGHHIVVSSSRGRGACAVKTFMKQLDQFDIQYDEIELNDNSNDITIVVGSFVCDARGDLHGALGLPGEIRSSDVVQPRHFNQLNITDNVVIKTSDEETLSGEAYYYENIPEELKHMFPSLLSTKNADGKISITISKLEGVTFSQLFVNRCIRETELNSLLSTIMKLHEHHCGVSEDKVSNVNYYENYSSKVKRRFNLHRALYENICSMDNTMDVSVFMDSIISALDLYEGSGRADIRDFIHGDPVFTNCILSQDGRTRLIDMNGKLGKVLTTSGDCTYDLAKILQSLYGYDYVLLDVPMDEVDLIILQNRRSDLREHLRKHYKRSWRDILLITASLFVSLIPLHNDFSQQVKFWRLAIDVYADWQKEPLYGE